MSNDNNTASPLKVTLILLAIFAVVSVIVYFMISGISNNSIVSSADEMPSKDAITAYIEQEQLLTTIDNIVHVEPVGPHYMMVTGKNADGKDTLLWFTNQKKKLTLINQALLEDGVSRDDILLDLAKKNIKEEQIRDMFVIPSDQSENNRLTWYVLREGARKHTIWYDFATGEQIHEIYQYPSASYD